MPKARTINWENLMGAVKRLPDSDLSVLLSTAKAKLEACGIGLGGGKASLRMGGENAGDNYNERSVMLWIESVTPGRMPRAVDDTTTQEAANRFHLLNLYATLVARGVKPVKAKKE